MGYISVIDDNRLDKVMDDGDIFVLDTGA